MEVGIDSIVAIPIDQWSLDQVTPHLKCVRKNGICIPTVSPDAPDPSETALIPFSSGDQPSWVVIDGNSAIPDIAGRVPTPGLYIIVAQYKQDNPGLIQIVIREITEIVATMFNVLFLILQRSPLI